jgi:hypothetical protein
MIEAALAAEIAAEALGEGAAAAGGTEMGAFGGHEVAGPEGSIAGEVNHSLAGAYENAQQFEQQLSDGESNVYEVESDWSSDAAARNADIIRQAFETEIDESKLLHAEGDGRPPNWQHAGDVLPPEQLSDAAREYAPEGVPIKENGCPDFTEWSEANVEIEMTGDRAEDYKRANDAAGFADAGYRSPEEGYVWHHNEDGETMQLVPADLHSSVPHRGGVYVVKALAEGKEVHGR